MVARRQWTITWNEKAGQFIARYRKWTGVGWGTKRVPRSIPRHAKLEAERWMADWYQQHLATGGLNAPKSNVTPIKKTLRLLGPRWLQYRYDDRGTKVNTYNGLKQSLEHYVLDNDKFEHFSIDGLDMEHDFTPEVCIAWIDSLHGAERTVLTHALDLKVLFEDCMAMTWVQLPANPMDHVLVKRRLAKLREDGEAAHIITYLDLGQVYALLTTATSKIIDYRRLRYLLALAAGLRDHEIQGLIWSDFHLDAPVPYVFIDRQLDKIGPKPFKHQRNLEKAGLSKDEMMAVPNAVVSDPKKKSFRAIPLLPLVVEALRHWYEHGWALYVGRTPERDDPVFPSGRRNTKSPAGQFCFGEFATLLRQDLERVGRETTYQGKALDFHATRRTFATMLNEAGVSDGDIGDLLGHKAKSVARGHYISPEVLERRFANLQRLPLPDRVQMQATLITAEGGKDAEVVEMPKKQKERERKKRKRS